MRALGDEGFYFMHLSLTSISSAAEVREQPLLIKISEQSHACRCLLCFCQKTPTHQIAAQTCILERFDSVAENVS